MKHKNIGTLYRYELKKIINNKLTIALLIVLTVVALLEGLSPGESETNEVCDLQHSLNGRMIDGNLLDEMYSIIDDYAIAWNESNAAYERVAYLEKNIIGSGEKLTDYTADEMYQIREADMFEMMVSDQLTNEEIGWWIDQESKITKPFTYYYNGGSLVLSRGLAGICLMMLLIAAMCLSTVFAGEHRQRTDQIVLSCANGRKETYFAKLAAGTTFIVTAFVVSSGILAAIIYARKGLDGMNTMIQMELPFSAYPLSIGQFIVIQFVLIFIASILFGILSMAFSELLGNGLAVMGLMVGCYFMDQFVDIPVKYRMLSQAEGWMPTNMVYLWSLYDHRLIHMGGHYFTNFHIAPALYILIAIVIYFLGQHVYCKYQVSGR